MGDKTWTFRKPDEAAQKRQAEARKLGYSDSRDMKMGLAADAEDLSAENPARKGTSEALLRGAKMMGANSMYSLLSGKAANKQTITVQSVRSQAGNKKQWSLFG